MNPEKRHSQSNPEKESRKKLLEKIEQMKSLGNELDMADEILGFSEKQNLSEEEKEFRIEFESMRKQLADLEIKTKRAGEELIGKKAEEDIVDSGAESDSKIKATGLDEEVEKLAEPQTDKVKESASEELSEQSDEIKKEKEDESMEKKEQKLLAENAEPKSPIDAWENEPEQMDKFKHFTREDVAELIKNGTTAEEIWEQAKDAGVFFKFDGSSYYLSQSSKGEKRKWRRRSGNNNTSDGHYEDKMFKYIESSVEDYSKLQEAYPSLKDAFTASNMLQAYGEKPTMNKMMSMSKYWDEIAKTITGYEAPESKEAESEDSAADDLSNSQENMNPEKPSISSGAEKNSESSTAENKPDIEAGPGDIVQYLDDDGNKVNEAVRVTDTKREDGKTLISFDRGKSFYPYADMVEESRLNKVETASDEQKTKEEESDKQDLITEEVFNNFVKNKEVPDEVIEQIAQKMANNSSDYTSQEMDIYDELDTEIEQRVKEIQQSTESEEGNENFNESKEDKPKTPESAEEKYIPKVGDDVYLMDSEDKLSRRWSEPKKVIYVEERRGKIYAEVEGEDDLFFAGKLQRDKANENEQNESNVSAEDVSDIDKEVAGKFQEQFKISTEELETVPGFEDLTTGQQKLVLDNFRKMTLSRIQEEGVRQHRENIKNAGTFSRLKQQFLNSYYKAKSQSEAGEQLLSGGIELHRDALSDIVAKTQESGLELDDDGEIIFFAEAPFDNLSMKDIEVIDNFNQAAKNFSRVSDSWRYEDAITENISGSTRSEYQKARQEYQSTLRAYIDFARKSKGEEGVRDAMEIDKKVRFTQFFSGDEDYEDALQKIKDEPAWRRMLDNVGLEKGGYLALGFGSRTAAYGTLATVTASLTAVFTAAGLNAYRTRSKTIEALEDEALVRQGGGESSLSRNTNSRFATMGKSENQAEVLNTVSAQQLTSKLRGLLDKLDDPNLSDDEKGDLTKQLHRRIQYTTQKIEGGTFKDENGKKEFAGGLVDYGDASGRSGRQYDLLQTLSEAQAISLLNSDPDIKDDISGRLDRYLAYKDEKTRRYVTEKTVRGAAFGASFAGIGASIAGFFSGEEATDVASQATESVDDSTDQWSGPVSPEEGDVDGLTNPQVFPEDSQADSVESDEWPGPVSPKEDEGVDLTDPQIFPEESLGGDEGIDLDQIDAESIGGGEEQVDIAGEEEAEPATPEAGMEQLGVQEVSINNKGEGMIHAIANKLETDFDVSREQAMRIGNELYIKGEQLGGNDEMYNLVGIGANFSLDFGELTAGELQEGSAQDLVDKITFSQETFDKGPTGIKGLDLPQQEAADVDVAVEDTTQQTNSIEKRGFEPEKIHKYDTSSFGDLNTRTVGMDLERFQEVLDTNNVTQDIHDRLDEGINSSRMSANSTYEGIRVSALSDLRDYLYANSDKGIIDMIEGMREENPRILITLDKVIALEDPDYGTPMQQLDRFITTGYLDMYATSENVSIPRPGPETASDALSQSADGAKETVKSGGFANENVDTRPENPIQRKNIDGMTIAEANEQAAAKEVAEANAARDADQNITRTVVSESQESSPEAQGNPGADQVDEDLRAEGIEVDPQETTSNGPDLSGEMEVLASKVDEIPIDRLRELVATMEAQSVIDSSYINVPTERLDSLEIFFKENSASKPSDIILKMAETNPELLTAFERVMNLDDSGDTLDRKSLQPLYSFTKNLVGQLTDADFPNGVPDYARHSMDVSKFN